MAQDVEAGHDHHEANGTANGADEAADPREDGTGAASTSAGGADAAAAANGKQQKSKTEKLKERKKRNKLNKQLRRSAGVHHACTVLAGRTRGDAVVRW